MLIGSVTVTQIVLSVWLIGSVWDLIFYIQPLVKNIIFSVLIALFWPAFIIFGTLLTTMLRVLKKWKSVN